MRYGETWPAPTGAGGPAVSPSPYPWSAGADALHPNCPWGGTEGAPCRARPVRTRADRALSIAIKLLDARDAHRTLAPELGCLDCSAGPGEWCDPWCPRMNAAGE